jgi:uncharacterized protein (DUF2267 family)
MTIQLREDVVYILLKKLDEADRRQGKQEVGFTDADFIGRELTKADLLGHLDYLNQEHYINAEFTGNAYGNQEDVPDALNPKEVDIRIANTYAAPDGPLPHLIAFKQAELTDKGRKMLQKMETNPPKSLKEGPATPIATKDMPFLEKVMLRGELEDIFDARDVTEVVFRTMRDMMTTEAADRITNELHEEAEPTKDKALQNEIADLWKDTNPIVAFLSRVRPPLKIKPENFIRRVNQEAGLPKGAEPETVIKAVFSATKDELSQERVQEIAKFLPGEIQQMWERA